MKTRLAPVSVLSIGAVTPLGRDLAKLREKLAVAPLRSAGVLRVDDNLLTNPATSTQLRRADRFTRMAVAAAEDAWNGASASSAKVAAERIGLILSSGFGPHCRGFRFLDGILDSGDTAASPTDFSHSVHGAAAAYISRLLDIRGPSLSVTDFETGFEESIRIAQCWLSEGACDRVLVGAVEELGEVYLSCAERMLADREGIAAGEGAVFLMIAPKAVTGIAQLDATASPGLVDLLAVEEPPLFAAPASKVDIAARRNVSFTQSFGHSASASAFSLLGGLLARGDAIDTAATLRTSSHGRSITLVLEK